MMEMTLNTVIMLTGEDRKILVDRLNELIPFKVKIITSFDEFEPEFGLEYDNLVLIDSVVKNSEFFSKLEFFREVFDMKCFFISSDEVWQNAMRKYCGVVDVDYRQLDYRMLVAVIYGDTSVQQEYRKENGDEVLSIARDVVKNSSTDADKLVLAREFIAATELLAMYQEREESLTSSCTELMNETLAARQETGRYMRAYNALFEKIYTVNRFLMQSNALNTQDV